MLILYCLLLCFFISSCQPDTGLSVIIALQAASSNYSNQRALIDKAWCKLDLFDQQLRLVSGRWRLPARMLPIKSTMLTHDMNSVQQVRTP